MKKLFIVLLLLNGLNAFSQFSKGTRTVGLNLAGISFTNYQQSFDYGNLGVASNTNNGFNVSLQPSIGKFVDDKLLIGGGPSINFSTVKFTSRGNNYSGNTFTGGVNVFGRYYFGGESFLPFLQVNTGVAFGGGSQDGEGNGTLANNQAYTSKYTENFKSILNFSGGIGAGLTKMINKNVGLDISLSYGFNRRSYNYTATNNVTYTNPASSEQQKTEYKFTGTTNNVGASVGIVVFLDAKK
jgi:hypothetical protein